MTQTHFDADRLGLLISSSNVVVEPVAMRHCLRAGVQLYVGRYRVFEGARPNPLPVGFDGEIEVADILSDAKVDLMCTTGTAAGWLGYGTEDELLAAIREKTGCPTYSLVHAVRDALTEIAARKVVFVTPYGEHIRDGIDRQFAEFGIAASHRYVEEKDNLLRAAIPAETLRDLCCAGADYAPDAIVMFCANFDGEAIASELSEQLGIKVIDGVSEMVTRAFALIRKIKASATIKGE